MPGVIFVDDEPAARRGLRRLLEAHRDVRILGEADSVASAHRLLHATRPDVVFLDIEMPRATGFELLEALTASRTSVIFVTAHSQHAPRAFEVEALDYLLKPVRPERLAQALDRARRAVSAPGAPGVPEETPPYGLRDYLTLRHHKKTTVVPVERIAALQAEGDFTRFLITGERPILMGYGLHKYAAQLPQPPFLRVSRSLVVNLRQVKSLESLSRDASELILHGLPETFLLRRLAAARLRAAMS